MQRYTKALFITLTGISTCLMSACTTVDLSQVSFEPQAETARAHTQNVVQKAAHSMVALFETKGWCKTDLKEKTQTAASVLLNGLDNDMDKDVITSRAILVVKSGQLLEDIGLANAQVEQITKAAEIYMATADDAADIGVELTLLESALLTAREAETNFDMSLAQSGTTRSQREFEAFQGAIKDLKGITDTYGDRMRSQISLRANRQHS